MAYFVIGLLILVYVFETIISSLNHQMRKKPIPKLAEGIYDEEKYQKWLNYSLDTHQFSQVQRGVSLLLMLSFLVFGVFGWLESLTNAWSSSAILNTLYFLGIYAVFSMIISIPFRYYQQFVIEAKYGFNKTTKKTFVSDYIKRLVITFVLGGGIIAGLHAIYLLVVDSQGGIWTFIGLAWVAAALFIMILFLFLNRLLIRLFNKVTPLPEGELRDKIEALAHQVGFNLKALYVMDASKRSTKLNAFFTGIGKTKEVVLFDTLVEKMSTDEILAVLAHELGHSVHKDVIRMLMQQLLILGLYVGLIGAVLSIPSLHTAFGLTSVHVGFSVILFMILISPIELILGIPLNYLSRVAEYKADAFSASMTSKEAMRSALNVLYQQNLSNLNPHKAAILLYYSHPAIADRLGALQ
ncbi:MAG: M48 family peptidase [Acholeplasma sp.]|jgi:STE24 endopeptidase|nr:MAG: M48 family peptidase [Acholeplasma sp.]